MTKKNKNKNVKLDNPEEDTGSITYLKKDDILLLRLVADGESGQGMPYAPIDWPNQGDIWGWKVGKRITGSGFMADRYLFPPQSLQIPGQSRLKFSSLQSAKTYIETTFSKEESDGLFASFSWKIPAKKYKWEKDQLYIHPKEDMGCKAGNKLCSVQSQSKSASLPAMHCNLCCSETGFCRDCCCILCCGTIGSAYGDYSSIRCEAEIEAHICGHIAHINCAVHCFMAGTVGGDVIALDVEYYCRRCDQRTNLIPHVREIIETCKSLDSREDVRKALEVGLSILRGSKRDDAIGLHKYIQSTLVKLKNATMLNQIWNHEDNASVDPEGAVSHAGDNGTSLENPQLTDGQYLAAYHEERRSQEPACTTSNHQRYASKDYDEINQTLQQLRKSQESEYRIAEERLKAKKDHLLSLYEQLDKETLELAKPSSSTMGGNVNSLPTKEPNIPDQIKQELKKLEDMMKIAKGFGRTPRGILKEHFDLELED